MVVMTGHTTLVKDLFTTLMLFSLYHLHHKKVQIIGKILFHQKVKNTIDILIIYVYNRREKTMKQEEFEKVQNKIKEKLGNDNFAKISDDIATLMSENNNSRASESGSIIIDRIDSGGRRRCGRAEPLILLYQETDAPDTCGIGRTKEKT